MDYRKIIIELADKVDIISFDIFDTLLFRSVRTPQRVFNKTFNKTPDSFPDFFSNEDWKTLRSSLPKIAKEKTENPEGIRLNDYLAEVPSHISLCEGLYDAEIESEKECAILNPDIWGLIKELKRDYHKKIILVSDMYLRDKDIREILVSAGVDFELIDDLFVSNEYGTRKSTGNLYETVCNKLGCDPSKILHVGDNWISDYSNARRAGLNTVLYPVIEEAKYNYPYLRYEGQLYYKNDGMAEEIYAIRCLAASHAVGTEEEKAWFEMGAMTYGPLLTMAAEWVLDNAEENNIRNIYPFMREGIFLSELLKKAAEYRNWKGRIEPIFISRRALFPALLSVVEPRDIFFAFQANTGISRNLTIGEVLDMYGADSNDDLYEFKNLNILQSKKCFKNEVSVSTVLNEKFFSNIEGTREKCKDSDSFLWEYFKTLNMDREDFITFDFGYVGTTQNAIQRILNHHRCKNHALQLLVMGKQTILERGNLGNDTDIRGFVSTLGDNVYITDPMNRQICDSLLKCRYSSVTGYEKKDMGVVPVFGEPDYNEETLGGVEAFQRGVMEFQKIWLQIGKDRDVTLNCSKEEALCLAARLTVFPTSKEAKLLGKLSSDNTRIIEEKELSEYKKMGYEDFFRDRFRKGNAKQWYQGMDVIVNEKKYYCESKHYTPIEDEYLYVLFAEKALKSGNNFVLVGNFREISFFAWASYLIDYWSRVNSVIIEDVEIQDLEYRGKKLISVNDLDKGTSVVILTRNKDLIEKKRKELGALSLDLQILCFYD